MKSQRPFNPYQAPVAVDSVLPAGGPGPARRLLATYRFARIGMQLIYYSVAVVFIGTLGTYFVALLFSSGSEGASSIGASEGQFIFTALMSLLVFGSFIGIMLGLGFLVAAPMPMEKVLAATVVGLVVLQFALAIGSGLYRQSEGPGLGEPDPWRSMINLATLFLNFLSLLLFFLYFRMVAGNINSARLCNRTHWAMGFWFGIFGLLVLFGAGSYFLASQNRESASEAIGPLLGLFGLVAIVVVIAAIATLLVMLRTGIDETSVGPRFDPEMNT